MYKFWYDYVKPKIVKMQNIVIWIQTTSLFMLKQKIFIKILQKMLKKKIDISNFELDGPLPKMKEKVIGFMKNELGGKIMTKVVGLRAKTYSY